MAALPVSANDASGPTQVANKNAIVAAIDYQTLPTGIVYVSAGPVLTGANNTLTMQGTADGTILRNQNYTGDYIVDGAIAVRAGLNGMQWISFPGIDVAPATMPAGQVGWVFEYNGPGGDVSRQGSVTRYKPGEAVTAPGAGYSFMRAYRGVPFTDSGITLTVPSGHGLAVGDYVFATDGPYANELRTEWRKITQVRPLYVRINRALKRAYTRGTLCAGTWPQGIRFRYLTFEGALGVIIVQQATDIRFTACTFKLNAYAGQLSIVGCGNILLEGCDIECVLQSSSSHDVTVTRCTIGGISAEQSARNFRFHACTFTGAFDAIYECTGWTITDCLWDEVGTVHLYDEWLVTDCSAVGGAYVKVRGGRATLRRFTADCPVVAGDIVAATYSGSPEGAGRNITFDRVTAPQIYLSPGTSGTITNCDSTVVAANAATAAEWTRDGGAVSYP